ncbi:MAG: hypothetical protein QM589_18795 [Thermomicrobiales bacterium]
MEKMETGIEMTPPQPGETCPCCGRKVATNAKPKQSAEAVREHRREYNQRDEVKERRKAYNAKRNAELRELRALQRTLEAQAAEDDSSFPA